MHINLENEYFVKWKGEVNRQPKCSVLYKYIKLEPKLEREYYLTNLPDELCFAMARIRTCNHRLPIEAGRYGVNRANREDRICTKCNSGVVGDEFHFILTCTNPQLLELREKYISPYYTLSPSRDRLHELFNNKGRKLFRLARYVREGLKLY